VSGSRTAAFAAPRSLDFIKRQRPRISFCGFPCEIVIAGYNGRERNGMQKSFDDLTIADDFMFCKVMQNKELCKIFLEMILADKIGKIAHLSTQYNITTYEEAKSVRFDVLVQNRIGKIYDIEMQVSDEHNLPKRMRFYQAAIDISVLDKGNSYSKLNDSFVIFICLFDAPGKGKPVYSFENICLEDRQTLLHDGAKKIIINSAAFNKIEDKSLSGLLEYIKTGKATTEFTGRLDDMIRTVKDNEQARNEYRIMSATMMDARDEGERRKALEDAKNFKRLGVSVDIITRATGLAREEVEKL